MNCNRILVYLCVFLLVPHLNVNGQLRLKTGVFPNGEYRPGGDAMLLEYASVRSALGLSATQEKKIVATLRQLAVMGADLDKKVVGPRKIDMDEYYKEFNALSASLVADGLTEKQRSRFKEIVYQSNGLEPFYRSEVRKALMLSEQQISQIAELHKAQVKESLKGVRDNEKFEKAYLDRAVGTLTEAQRPIWSSLIGKTIELGKPD